MTCNSIRSRVLAMHEHAYCVFTRRFVGVPIIYDRRDGKHAAKVFFGCFVAPTGLENEAKSKGAGCDKTSKKYICRIFSNKRDQNIKEGGEFRTSALVVRMLLIINSKNSSNSVTNAILFKCCSSCYQRYALCASNFYHQTQVWVL